jgi:ABC-type dipeptide/oligopeptide/nickel transport system permease subunit
VSTGAPELLEETGGNITPGRVETPEEIAARSPLELFWRRIRQDKVTMVSLIFILILIFCAVFAKQIIELVNARPPNEQSTEFLDEFGSASGPNFAENSYFGTDGLGRDVFSRTLYGARISLEVAIISTALTVLIGVTLGVIAGYYRGWADTVLSRLMDVMLAFPVLLLALGLGAACSFGDGCIQMDFTRVGSIMMAFSVVGALATVGWRVLRGRREGFPAPRVRELLAGAAAWLVIFIPGLILAAIVRGDGALISPGLPVVIFVIVIASWPYIARIIRGQTLSLREKEFVEAAKALGATDRRIMFRHILPNLVAPIIVYTTLVIPTTILFEAALSFLGVGVQPPTASWGAMISDATEIFDTAWWYMTFPGLALVLTVLAFNLVGDGMQDALNPKTSGR